MIVLEIILICCGLVCVYGIAKTFNVDTNQTIILKAIDRYVKETEDYETGTYLVMIIEDFDKTLWRFWDWGYTRILPKEKYEIIKPYIQSKKGK